MGFKELLQCVNWLALAVALTVCVGLVSGSSIQSSTIQLQPLRISVGNKAPELALPSADGKVVKLSDFAGHNTLIDFYRGYW